MRAAPQTAEKGQPREVFVVNTAYLEHIEGTHVDAIALALASRPVDHGLERARLGAAQLSWTRGILRGPARLVLVA
jgi:hypothetical protein